MKKVRKTENTKHLPWIDLLRIVSISLVVLCHATEEGIYNLSLSSVLSMQSACRIFPFTCFTLGRLGVPLFLLISGYLFLDREYNVLTTKRFWKKT